jgi:hypothetical protein
MKRVISIALGLGFAVGACVAYEAHSTYLDSCGYLKREASKASQAPIASNAPEIFGFTPMDQFGKIYPPNCAPEDDVAEIVGSVAGGVFTALFILFASSMIKFALNFHHKEH